MPKLPSNRLPAYCHHKASGQAVVTLDGKDHYLGPHGTKSSKEKYKRLTARWQGGDLKQKAGDLTVGEVAWKYWQHVQGYYVKNGLPTAEQFCIKYALRPMLVLYEDEPAAEFGPLALEAVREQMIRVGQCRQTVNVNTGRVRRMFKWAESKQLVPKNTYQTLCTVAGLQAGRTKARESDPVEPVSDEQVEAVLPHLTATIADMVRFQRFTGCRPNEVCQLRPCDIDRSGDVWRYVPQTHKTVHRNKQRVIQIGPKAQAVLSRYLARGTEMYCFRPIDSEAKRRAEQHANRKTPLSCGNKPGSNRKRRPQRTPSDRYTTLSYGRAVQCGCDRAFPLPQLLRRAKGETTGQWRKRITGLSKEIVAEHYAKHRWTPNQLRHAAATEIRSLFGLEASQVILGHSKADVTQVYAKRDQDKAADVARRIG